MIVEFLVSETQFGVCRTTKKNGESVVTFFLSQQEMDCLILEAKRHGND